jgi:hypothetical protein
VNNLPDDLVADGSATLIDEGGEDEGGEHHVRIVPVAVKPIDDGIVMLRTAESLLSKLAMMLGRMNDAA